MEKFTLRDLASNKFTMLSDFDIVKVEDVESVSVRVTSEQKVVTIHIGPYDFLFNSNLKSSITAKIKSDLGDTSTKYRFAI